MEGKNRVLKINVVFFQCWNIVLQWTTEPYTARGGGCPAGQSWHRRGSRRMDMVLLKKELRRQVLKKRAELSAEDRESKSRSICSQVISLLDGHARLAEGGSLFAFMPFGEEVDIRPVAEWCLRMGYPLAVPKTLRESRELRLHCIQSLDELRPGVWGIPEPSGSEPLADPRRIAVALVPGVAFDATGARMGYGGGYYDRLLRRLGQQGVRPLKLAPAFELQLCPRVPMEPHDEKMDIIVTESRVIKRNRS